MGKFVKGKSGNPKGRPKGIPDKRTALKDLLKPHAEELVNKAMELVRAGDVAALRLCMERLIPKVSSVSLSVEPSEDCDLQQVAGLLEKYKRDY